jgi:protein SCO1/2
MNAMKRAACLSIILLLFATQSWAKKHYPATGLVLQFDRSLGTIEISCQPIPGYMEAMAMNLQVHNRRSLSNLKPGTMIDFTLTLDGTVAYVDDIHIHEYQNSAQEPMAARQLKILEDATASKSQPAPQLAVGQQVPNFTLTDQNNQPVALSQFAGKVVAVTFIYTSCPLPNFCFRLSNNFGVVYKKFHSRISDDLVLLSVTFDPVHDQPEVLEQYSRTWKKDDAKGWYFLTGAPADVQAVCSEFGMNFSQDEGQMTHSLHTVVIDRHGRVAANLEGNEFTPQQLGDLLQSVMVHGN